MGCLHLISFFLKAEVMKEKLQGLLQDVVDELSGILTEEEFQVLRVKYLGRKGALTAIMKGVGALSPDERPAIGQIVNSVRDQLEQRFDSALNAIRERRKSEKLRVEKLDVTLPGRRRQRKSWPP